MATKEVLFRITIFDDSCKVVHLKYTHPLPAEYCVPMPSAELERTIASVTHAIVQEHHLAILEGSAEKCVQCFSERKTTTEGIIPMLAELEPMVQTFSFPVCSEERCMARTKDIMVGLIGGQIQEMRRLACGACNHANAPLRCTACKKVRYCGKECQKAHWNEHKSVCSTG